MFNDPISDMLTRIRNGLLARKKEVEIPFSKIKMGIAQILAKEGLILKVEKTEAFPENLKIELKYINKEPIITSLKRVSVPSCRMYVDKDHLPKVRNNMGIAIISTSQGLMTNKEAGQKKIGGELLCEIY
ncbi:MAG: 30S ribosomal protein S8 [Candidatus Magasanikbacteria bacterium]|nr:30S ribosomal protein S8 [Candidatus Magasanikbacteria bacterium]